MINRPGSSIFFILGILLAAGCQMVRGDGLLSDAGERASLPETGEVEAGAELSNFNVLFDENQDCVVEGPDQVPAGTYTFELDDRSGLNVDLNVVHLIDGHSYQDLLGLQDKPGEPFVKVYWMSLPFYFTADHVVWTYTLDEPGEHAILILQHVFEGSWICDPFLVSE